MRTLSLTKIHYHWSQILQPLCQPEIHHLWTRGAWWNRKSLRFSPCWIGRSKLNCAIWRHDFKSIRGVPILVWGSPKRNGYWEDPLNGLGTPNPLWGSRCPQTIQGIPEPLWGCASQRIPEPLWGHVQSQTHSAMELVSIWELRFLSPHWSSKQIRDPKAVWGSPNRFG